MDAKSNKNTVLIVDDDQSFLRHAEDFLHVYAENLRGMTAFDGKQALQILGGRPGFDGGTAEDIRDGEADPVVVLGGGERYFLPEGAKICGAQITPDCAVHVDPVTGAGPARRDGRDLLREAVADGWTVIRTRKEFEALSARLEANAIRFPSGDHVGSEAPQVIDSESAAEIVRSRITTASKSPATIAGASSIRRIRSPPLRRY